VKPPAPPGAKAEFVTNLLPVPVEEALAALGSRRDGLTEAQAQRRLAEFGPNELDVRRSRSLLRDALSRLAHPLVAVLLIASALSALVRDLVDAMILVGIAGLSLTLELVQTRRAQRAAEALRAQVAHTATVLRDGAWQERARAELVPGDVIRLGAGDLVPADARLLESRDLHVQQAALTGESLPVEKDAAAAPAPADDASQARDAVFLGSSVVSGSALALVVATGARTTFGEVARLVAARPPQTEFERGAIEFGLFIARAVFFLVVIVFLATTVLHHDPLESMLFAIALAVGLTPEFLPMISAVTLSRGAVRMARQHVIVKNLAAIQNLGSIDVLCSDKTGTLTVGELELEAHVDAQGRESERPLLLGAINSALETGVTNPVDEAVLRRASVNPLDRAVLRHPHPELDGWTKRDEVPFDFERRRVSVVAERRELRLLIVKGAPESVLADCATVEVDGRLVPLSDEWRERCEATHRAFGEKGLRVIAVAWREAQPRSAWRACDECDLALAGFLAFADPPLEGVADVLAGLREAGVEVKILTGDSELVTAHVCEQVGIDADRIVLGHEVDRMSDPALAHVAQQTRVFARVAPAQKSRILRALRSRGRVVGYLGDGINDAPSLHVADVGISVAGATDVAREAADIILLEGRLGVLLGGLIEGRRSFGNVIKYLLMGTSSNFGNMLSMAVASFVLPFLPMLPTQILLNNFLYDLAQLTLPTDRVDPELTRRPRRWDVGFIRRFMLVMGPLSSLYDFLTFFVLLYVFRASVPLFRTGWFVESLATQTLVIFVLRTAGSPLRSRPSAALAATALGAVAAAVALPLSPLAGPLAFVPLPAGFLSFLVVAVVTYLVLVECVKRPLMRKLLS